MHSNLRLPNRLKRRKLLSKIITIVMVGTLLIFMTKSIIEQFSLQSKHELTTGIITNYSYSMNGGALSFYFDYEVNGKKYKSSSVHSDANHAYAKYFIGKQFPVAYKENDVTKCRMIITTLDFRKFSIPFPDSLKWVHQYEL